MPLKSITLYRIFSKARTSVSKSFQALLEQKRLYQSIQADLSIDQDGIIKTVVPSNLSTPMNEITALQRYQHDEITRRSIGENQKILETVPWHMLAGEVELGDINDRSLNYKSLDIRLPDIKIPCDFCDNTIQPHNPVIVDGLPDGLSAQLGFQRQLFYLPYLCQACKRETLIFIVRREGAKLTIVGRSRFEPVIIPKAMKNLPESRFYRDAVIAFNTGRILASLFYLRTLIEQYFRRVLAITENEKVTGDIMAKFYRRLLDSEFPPKFDTLGKAYEALSISIHGAKEDEGLYSNTISDIEQHFEMLTHFPIGNIQDTDLRQQLTDFLKEQENSPPQKTKNRKRRRPHD